MMAAIRRPGGGRLLDAFTVNVFGRDLPGGKPDPAMFQLAAAELGVPADACVVFEDAAAGVAAARAAGMRSIGVARLGDASALRLAGADLVVTSLDEVSIENLTAGPASRRRPDRGPRPDRWADANGGRGPSPERDAERTAPD